ncbi:unnamed protein product [Gongylonema pulchrum]|uniref:DOCKER domain-containing protein n=1 Tax=Gongylonema pulchrum TaxID=637853 RepID=A0A183CXJ5_9BILA|nr:unnamed protein product [Gongylonema pulchrum]
MVDEAQNRGREVEDAIHELHVLYMRYFSLEDPFRNALGCAAERQQLLERMGTVVDEILNAKERPSWLHPAMFPGPLVSAFCSLPPNPNKKDVLLPLTPDPRDVYWSKFSICNHSRPLESQPLVMSVRYYPPSPRKAPVSSGYSITSEDSRSESSISIHSQCSSMTAPSKSAIPRLGALSDNRFRDRWVFYSSLLLSSVPHKERGNRRERA